ncbi:MAG: purine-binding chemotaxis protein CheW [Candidatus Dadabacteria bacterium]|nr:MAG: purine-binding chemotaxis protein CheW [Candidatus Dadabacteria bacterium]
MTEIGKPAEDEILQLVTFHAGDEEFGVNILEVREINRMMEITRVPHAPGFVEGVVNLRGQVIPVVDLRKRFGLPPRERDRSTRIVVVELGEKVVGFIVDSVSEVLRVPERLVEPPPPIVGGVDRQYIQGVVKLDDRLLILLDLRKLLGTGEEKELREFEP